MLAAGNRTARKLFIVEAGNEFIYRTLRTALRNESTLTCSLIAAHEVELTYSEMIEGRLRMRCIAGSLSTVSRDNAELDTWRRLMDPRREEAIQSLMATLPTMETFIPAMVDACNVGARREQVIEVLSASPLSSIFEAKYRAALAALSTEDLEEITAHFATQPASLLTALLKWASGLAWAATELNTDIIAEYRRLLSEG